jgi:single-stranded DNA-binding protein
MIDGLIAGKLFGAPQQKTGKSGKSFVVGKVRTAGGDGEGIFVNLIAFDSGACTALLALGDGDAVSLAGSLTPKVWTDREGNARPALDIVAHQVLTAYHVQRRRKAASNEPQQRDGEEFQTEAR